MRDVDAEIREHLRKWLYAPSGTPICTCNLTRDDRVCWYCAGRALLLAAGQP